MPKKIRDEVIKPIKVRKRFQIKMPPLHGRESAYREVILQDYEMIIFNRGIIINAAITLEEDVEDILELLLKSDLYDSSDFGGKIWRLRNIDFSVKWNILRGLVDTHYIIQKDLDKWNRLVIILNKIASIRNNFAHGRIYFEDYKFYLMFIKERRVVNKALDNEYFDEIRNEINDALELSKELKIKTMDYLQENDY